MLTGVDYTPESKIASKNVSPPIFPIFSTKLNAHMSIGNVLCKYRHWKLIAKCLNFSVRSRPNGHYSMCAVATEFACFSPFEYTYLNIILLYTCSILGDYCPFCRRNKNADVHVLIAPCVSRP